MEFAQACKAFGVRPIVGRRADGERRHPAVSPHAPGRERDRVAESLPADHRGPRGTRPRPGSRPPPPRPAARPRSSSGPRGSSASRGALATGRSRGRSSARVAARPPREARAAEALGRRLAGAFGPERFRVELQRPFWRHDRARNRWLEGLAERLGVRCVATRQRPHARPLAGAASGHAGRRAPEGDAGGDRARAARERARPISPRRRRWPPASREHPDAVAESARIAERLGFDLTRDLGYRYPGSEDPDADRTLAEICGARLDHRYAGGRERRRGAAAAGGGAAR